MACAPGRASGAGTAGAIRVGRQGRAAEMESAIITTCASGWQAQYRSGVPRQRCTPGRSPRAAQELHAHNRVRTFSGVFERLADVMKQGGAPTRRVSSSKLDASKPASIATSMEVVQHILGVARCGSAVCPACARFRGACPLAPPVAPLLRLPARYGALPRFLARSYSSSMRAG